MIRACEREGQSAESLRSELRRRLSRRQRHRLLQGFPMAPLMLPASQNHDPFRGLALAPERPLIIGVLPHTFCNPKVKGCGFCTFPHETFRSDAMRRVAAQVEREIELTVQAQPTLKERRVDAIYIGGGTANLSPPHQLERIGSRLAAAFDVSTAELTLEGVPKYFLLRNEALLDMLTRVAVRHRRVSMGIQTFDAPWLTRMGRDAFGSHRDVQRVVDAAHQRGITTSADLLFNLPGTSLGHTLTDVRAAIDIGFDQVCVYNLVLTANIGSEWANDRSLLNALPSAAQSVATWLAARQTLLECGYEQTTLTNFERADITPTSRRFAYEIASFDPATYDALGFGPGAISTFTSGDRQRARKWMNLPTSDAYTRALAESDNGLASLFHYTATDLKLLHLTRSLSRLHIDCAAYEAFFGVGPDADFGLHFSALEDARLVRRRRASIELTPEGMFYADAVAGFLAYQRVAQLRAGPDDSAARQQHMG